MAFGSVVQMAMRQTGQDYEVRRGDQSELLKGAKTGKGSIIFYPDADVQPGDWLRGTISREEYHVRDAETQVVDGKPLMRRANVEAKARHEERIASTRPQPAVFNIQEAHGSIIGTHNHAELMATFDFRSIETEIERRGGEDTEELKLMVAEIRDLLDNGDELDRGALAKFSGLMERHSWITNAVAGFLLGFATQTT